MLFSEYDITGEILRAEWVNHSSFALIEYYCGHFMTLSQDLLHESFLKKYQSTWSPSINLYTEMLNILGHLSADLFDMQALLSFQKLLTHCNSASGQFE